MATCPARAALAGNPSDGYGGAVVAVPIPDLLATAVTTEADRTTIHGDDPDLRRLLEATIDGFSESVGSCPTVTISASTTIPRSVGLAGSSALVLATLRSLGGWVERQWEQVELAELALAIERDRLGITAGLQDRLVQSVNRPVLMHFDPVSFETAPIPTTLPMFVAWHTGAAEPSDVVHRSLRRRFDAGDLEVVTAMRELAGQARCAHRALVDGRPDLLAEAMDRSFDLRTSIIEVSELQHRLVATGRRCGAAVNSAGSGGSVIGLAESPDDLPTLEQAYASFGATFLPLTN